MKILALNSGSSSQKVCLYELGEALPTDPPPCLWEARIEWAGKRGAITVKDPQGQVRRTQVQISSRMEALQRLLAGLSEGPAKVISALSDIKVVGHRVVHGGPKYEQPVLITPEVKS